LDIGCIVLAGGKGLRLGRDKTLEVIGNSNLLQRVVSQLSSFNSNIIVVVARGKSLSQFSRYPRFRIVTDIYPGKGAGFDLVVPRVGDWVEPLHAVYSKDCLNPIERLLEQGEIRVRALFELVKVRYIEGDEISRFDPEHLSFFNVNTEADLERAQQLLKETNGDKR
jgi:molybdopterin-guanine dinucleotide biosynthesis protein A